MTLYIHIPFCTSRCGYCTFNSFENQHALQDSFLEALLLDLQNSSHQFASHKEPLRSIFFGGGTPNTLPHQSYEKIFSTIRESYSLIEDCEITMEANPNLLTKEWCLHVKNLGVNRLSIGVQSFFEDKLTFLQREHSYKDIHTALDCALESGIENLSIDLIYDTPLDTPSRIYQEISQASTLPINHLSAYSLTIEKDSKLERQGIKPTKESLFTEVRENLGNFGFLQYEVSNYAKPYKVQHNLAYWDYEDYIGCGCGAVGKVGNVRFYTHTNLTNYIAHPTHRKTESLSQSEQTFEKIFLGLRCELGVPLSLLDPRKLQPLLESHKILLKNQRVFASDYFLADEIALWLA